MTVYDAVWSRYQRVPVRGAYAAATRRRLQEEEVSQGELARRAGYDPSHISRWLSGHVEPTLETKLILDEAIDAILKERPNV